MTKTARVVIWESRQEPGLERATLSELPDGWRLGGTLVAVSAGQPALVTYAVTTDAAWLTRHVEVTATLGAAPPVTITLARDAAGDWSATRTPDPGAPWFDPATVAGLADIDLAFSPATNLLPIRRRQPAIGEKAAVTAAWLRFPELVIEPLPQSYTRRSATHFDYESNAGEFTAGIEVDELGMVVDYEGLFRRVADTRLP